MYTPDRPLDPPEYKDCKYCDGEGKTNTSSCCGADPVGNGDCDTSDIGICPQCKDHCDYDTDCPECDGTGTSDETI